MTQMTRVALKALNNTTYVENTSGLITATASNTFNEDFLDSVQFLATGALAPVFRTFTIDNIPNAVDPDTTISGTLTFRWNITEEDNVSGNLTISQDGVNLSTTVDPKAGSIALAVNSATLMAGQSTDFTISGTDVFANNFSRVYSVTARSLFQYVYYGSDTDGVLTDFVAGASRTPYVGTPRTFTIPNFTGNRFIVIGQRSSEPQLSQIIIRGVDQFGAFTRTPNAFTVASENFDAYVSNQLQVGSTSSGLLVTLVR